MAPSSIYKAYTNKYELFAYAAEVVLAEQVYAVAERVDETDAPIDILTGILVDFYTLGRAHPHAAFYIFAAVPLAHHEDIPDASLLETIASMGQVVRAKLESRVVAAIEAGELRGDADTLTEHLLIASFGYIGIVQTGATTIGPADFAEMTVASLQAIGAME